MSKRVKFTPKELKKPDKFREAIATAITVASENYKKILLALAAVVIIVAGIFAVSSMLEKNKFQANSKFNDAMKSYSDGKNGEALKKFLTVKEEYPRADISTIALYYAATINYETAKYDEAIKLFNEFLSSDVEDQMLRDSAYLNIGLANFNKGDLQKAIDNLSKLDTEGSPYKRQAKLHIGLSLEKMGKYSEAEKTYKELLNETSGNNMGF
ncbi:MAG TPA: tetratricopeptide repeat protein [Thermodesulfobacteriota bacterium]|nr:tetratricopeptide repeat protein [Thermodesulfobacteriota bacterium]